MDLLTKDGIQHTAASWITTCLREHDNCGNHNDAKPGRRFEGLPARLVRIEQDSKLGLTARLYHVPENTTKIRYTTLSHRWGDHSFMKLERNKIKTFESDIPLLDRTFNQSFREAITISFLLGYEYIWIDSLCIIQDCHDDWKHQCPLMGSIYGNAELNLAASGFEDAKSGMIGNRNLILPPKIPGSTTLRVFCWDELECWPLEQRGWVQQESILVCEVFIV